jgi:hypothetical protein
MTTSEDILGAVLSLQEEEQLLLVEQLLDRLSPEADESEDRRIGRGVGAAPGRFCARDGGRDPVVGTTRRRLNTPDAPGRRISSFRGPRVPSSTGLVSPPQSGGSGAFSRGSGPRGPTDQRGSVGRRHFRGTIRWRRTRRFPYLLFYEVVDSSLIRIYAVAHGRRRLGYWMRRKFP